MKYIKKFETYSEGGFPIYKKEIEETDPWFEHEEELEEPEPEEEVEKIPPFEDPNEDLPEPYRSIHGHGQPHIRKF